VPRRRRPVVVALSGLDGSGKSTQAVALRDALLDAGVPAAVAWTKLGGTTWTADLAARLKGALRLGRRVGPAPRTYPSGARDDHVDTGTLLRRRSRAVTWAWTLLLVADNVRAHRRAVRDAGTAVVVCDRYVLDSVASLRHKYGDRPYRLHVLLLRRLSPAPSAAWYLEVPAAVALARKPEQFELAQLEALATCYRTAAAALGVDRLDGAVRPEVLTAALAGEVLRHAPDHADGPRAPRGPTPIRP
jgi:thymidylate kinase